MAFELSYAGVPLVIDTEEVRRWIDNKISLEDLSMLITPYSNETAGTISLALPQPTGAPPIKFGQFWYPSGATRWAQFSALITEKEYNQIVPLAFDASQGPVAKTFRLLQGDVEITTSLYLLPPRPLAKFADLPGLYLITLVDERYFWQWKYTQLTITDSTSWTDLLTTLVASLGISLTTTSIISSSYARPHPQGDLASSQENTARYLDAVCYNVGRRLVRNLNGSYTAQTFPEADAVITTNIPGVEKLLAGGDLTEQVLANGGANLAPGALLPSSVTVNFDNYQIGQGYIGRQKYHIPFVKNTGDKYSVTIPITSTAYSALIGFSGSKTLNTSAEHFLDASGSGTNDSDCQTLAQQLAQDYYDSQYQGLDVVYANLIGWSPEAADCIIWYWSDEDNKICTRIHREAYNWSAEEFNHHFVGGTPCNTTDNICNNVKYVSGSTVNISSTSILNVSGTTNLYGPVNIYNTSTLNLGVTNPIWNMDQIDYPVPATASVVAVDLIASQPVTLRSIASGADGRIVYFVNKSNSQPIILSHEDPTGAANNRLRLPLAQNDFLNTYEGIGFVYNATDKRWNTLDDVPSIDIISTVSGATFYAQNAIKVDDRAGFIVQPVGTVGSASQQIFLGLASASTNSWGVVTVTNQSMGAGAKYFSDKIGIGTTLPLSNSALDVRGYGGMYLAGSFYFGGGNFPVGETDGVLLGYDGSTVKVNLSIPTAAYTAGKVGGWTLDSTKGFGVHYRNGITPVFYFVNDDTSVVTTVGGITTLNTGGGLSGGPITGTGGTVSLATTSVVSGSYNFGAATFTVNSFGELTGATGGTSVSNLSAGTGLSTTSGTGSITLSLANTTVIPGTYPFGSITVDQQGRITGASAQTAVSTLSPGTGLTGNVTTGAVTLSLANTTVIPGTYPHSNLTVDQQGRITGATAGTAVTTLAAGTGLSTTAATGGITVSLANTSVVPGIYPYGNVTVDAQGRITSAASQTAVSTLAAGTGLSTTAATGSISVSLSNTAVTSGSYTNSNITVDAQGRITSASTGVGVGVSGGTTLQNLASQARPWNNLLINGGFDFAQRQSPATATTYNVSDKYTADRWRLSLQASGATYKRTDTVGGETEALLIARNYGTYQKTSSPGKILVCQPVEGINSVPLAGRPAVFQVKMKSSTTPTVKMGLLCLASGASIDSIPATLVSTWNNSSVDPTFAANVTVVATGSYVVNTVWNSYNVSGSFPSVAKNVIAAVWSDAQLQIADSVSFAEAGMFDGSVTRDWLPRPVEEEFDLCARYSQSYGGAVNELIGQAIGATTVGATLTTQLSAPLRVSPTVTISAQPDWSLSNPGLTENPLSGTPTVVAFGQRTLALSVPATGLTQARVYQLIASTTGGAGVNSRLTLDSEL